MVTTGCLAGALATALPGLLLATTAAILLGIGYGVCLIVGLTEVEQLAAPEELSAVVAVYYSLTYAGLAGPYLLALAAPALGYPLALVCLTAVAALTDPSRRPGQRPAPTVGGIGPRDTRPTAGKAQGRFRRRPHPANPGRPR
ncbi:hypothetical protein LG284_16500 (plasmid) [Citricoccus nitrophenolicus]